MASPENPPTGEYLTIQDILKGTQLRETFTVPDRFKKFGWAGKKAVIRPVNGEEVADCREAADKEGARTSAFVISIAVVEPKISAMEARTIPLGLSDWFGDCINYVSGIVAAPPDEMWIRLEDVEKRLSALENKIEATAKN